MRQLNRLKEIISKLDNSDLQKKVNELEVALSAIEITELRLLSALENGGHHFQERIEVSILLFQLPITQPQVHLLFFANLNYQVWKLSLSIC